MNEAMEAALERLVRQAMGAGVAYFAENMPRFQSDQNLGACFEGFPGEFVRIRADLVEDVLAAVGVES